MDPICTFLFSILVLITTFAIIRDTMVVLMEGGFKCFKFILYYSVSSFAVFIHLCMEKALSVLMRADLFPVYLILAGIHNRPIGYTCRHCFVVCLQCYNPSFIANIR